MIYRILELTTICHPRWRSIARRRACPVTAFSPRTPSPLPAPPGSDNSPMGAGRRTPSCDNDDYPPACLPNLKTSVRFARMVRKASLESQFDVEELDILQNPQEHGGSCPEDDPHLECSIQTFYSLPRAPSRRILTHAPERSRPFSRDSGALL